MRIYINNYTFKQYNYLISTIADIDFVSFFIIFLAVNEIL